MFIIAGYEEDIENCFFSYNKGLKRRFNAYYNIKSYKPSELREIFINKIKKLNYNLLINDNLLEKFFNDNKKNFEYFGGSVELLCNEIKHVQALRNFSNNINNNDIIFDDILNSMLNINNQNKDNNKISLSMYI
jgi:hypothetical protein